MVILGISHISQVAREGWLAKVHSEQFHRSSRLVLGAPGLARPAHTSEAAEIQVTGTLHLALSGGDRKCKYRKT